MNTGNYFIILIIHVFFQAVILASNQNMPSHRFKLYYKTITVAKAFGIVHVSGTKFHCGCC